MKNKFSVSIPIAILVTLISIIYQRSTGPTYPKKVYLRHGSEDIKIKFPRSHGGDTDCPVEVPLIEEGMQARVTYKRFPTEDAWTSIDFKKEGGLLVAHLPNQPPAGKLTYYVTVKTSERTQAFGSKEEPIFIRYKGLVPIWILAPHIFFMFISMLFSVLTAVEAWFKTESFRKLAFVTTGSLLIGGMCLGPIVQKFAFGVYWAGFPYDWDLTDNKLLISVIFWVLAAVMNIKKPRPGFVILAAIVLKGMYLIPHSAMGSQYDYKKGSVEIDRPVED